MIITRTPFRVSFLGGGTDYPVWFKQYDGAVLGTTINKYCYVTCRFLPAYLEHRTKVIYSQLEYVKENKEILHPAVRECLNFMDITDGIEIYHYADLPAQRGLGSSSAFTVGLLNALYGLRGKRIDKSQLARDAIFVEQEMIQENVGCQDQFHSAFGGLNLIKFNLTKTELTRVILKSERLEELQSYLMLFSTGIHRIASEIAYEQIKQTPYKKRELGLMYSYVFDGLDILYGNRDITEFGYLLDRSWRLKQSLTDRITTPIIDAIYSKALDAGALGGKLLGAGGGGFILLFVEPDKQNSVKEALRGHKSVPFRFEDGGSQIIFKQEIF